MTVLFWKAAAGIIIAAVLVMALGKQEKDLALMLSILACVMGIIISFVIFEPVLDFFYRLAELGNLKQDILGPLMKITGIAIVTELAQMICTDSGNSALAHGMQFLGTSTILLLSLPVLEILLDIVQQILGEL